jgi:hypothetical protein
MTTWGRLDSSRHHRRGVELALAEVCCFRVFPLYEQVEIRDATEGVDRPLWETGEERVLASAQCIVLATRSDMYGEVEIEVRVGAGLVGAGLEDQAARQLLFDGELLTTGQGILVGNSLTDLHHVGLPIGWHPIRIYADRPANPARFTVLLELRSAGH